MNIKQISGEREFRLQSGFKDKLNIFFSEDYKNYKLSTKSNFKFYYYLYTNDFVIPVLIHKYYIFCYAEFLSEPAQYNNTGEVEDDFINDICEYLRTNMKVQWVLSTPAYAFFNSYPRGSKVIPFGSQVLDMSLSIEDLYQKMDRKHREMTRRGEKGNVVVKISRNELIKDFCLLETKLWKRSRIEIDNSQNLFYENIINNISNNIIVCVAYKDDKPQVGLIVYFNEKIAYAMHAGRADEMEPGANNLLYWKVIEYLKLVGVEKFSIVGFRIDPELKSKVSDIQRFKIRFGGELKRGYMFKIEFKPMFHFMFEILMSLRNLIKFKTISKKSDIIDQEIHKWEEIQR